MGCVSCLLHSSVFISVSVLLRQLEKSGEKPGREPNDRKRSRKRNRNRRTHSPITFGLLGPTFWSGSNDRFPSSFVGVTFLVILVSIFIYICLFEMTGEQISSFHQTTVSCLSPFVHIGRTNELISTKL